MKALDLFCGVGGLSLGFKTAGFDVTGVDINQRNKSMLTHLIEGLSQKYSECYGKVGGNDSGA